jgi:hypothetical protein
MHSKTMLVAISIYQYLMSILMSIFLLIIPFIEPHQYFDTLFEDIFARCILWLYFVFSYWSISTVIKNRINKKNDLFIEMHKNIVSFVLLSISATMTGLFLLFLTKWSLVAFIPQFPNEIIFIISLGNGAIYAMLMLSQYYFLPVE